MVSVDNPSLFLFLNVLAEFSEAQYSFHWKGKLGRLLPQSVGLTLNRAHMKLAIQLISSQISGSLQACIRQILFSLARKVSGTPARFSYSGGGTFGGAENSRISPFSLATR